MSRLFLLIGGVFIVALIAVGVLAFTFSMLFKLAATTPSGTASTNPPAVSPATEPEPTYILQTPYHTEEEWIVSSICRNAFEILSYATDKKGEVVPPENVTVKKIPGNDTAYDVTLHGAHVTVETTLHWPGSIWSSTPYVPFCQAAMAQLKLTPPTAPPQVKGAPLETLLDFSEASIQAENQRLSTWISDDPANTVAQQQAAFLLGVLALKENSGWFWDPRDVCNHLVAHLAVARALAPNAALIPEGRLAECITGLIADTKKECAGQLDQLDQLSPTSPALAAWVRAGRMRNTRDWRLLAKPDTASPVEQVEYFRAVSEAVSTGPAVAWLQNKSIPQRQDWNRIVLESHFSVDDGHTFATPAVKGEIDLMQATFPGRFDLAHIVASLNQLSGDVLTRDTDGTSALTVVGDGQWAQFFQRHLCHAIVENGRFLKRLWGVPDDAQAFYQATDRNFSGLTLYPYLRLANADLGYGAQDPRAVLAAFTRHPELAGDWIYELKPGGNVDGARYREFVGNWFSPAFPSGTAYSAFSRLENVGLSLSKQPAAVHQLYLIAPLQYRVAQVELRNRYGAHPTYQQVREVTGSLADYYLRALELAANAPDTTLDNQVALLREAAQIDPNRYYNLADALRAGGRDADAAAAFQKWSDEATDRVTVSNGIEWLVNYDYDHGQQGQAMVLAQDAAEVYSYRGLETMMHLLERMNRLAEAEAYGRKIAERYRDNTPLITFYKRQADLGNADYKAKYETAIGSIFPEGLKRVTPASFSGPPAHGLKFNGTTNFMQQNGVNTSEIIVALDGYQVDNVAQYTFVRGPSDSPEIRLIVWDGESYRERTVNLPGRRFGVEMSDYSR